MTREYLGDRLRKSAIECEFTTRAKLLTEAARVTDLMFVALRGMTEWWAYGLDKPPDAEPSPDDLKKVEQLARQAMDALYTAWPEYIFEGPAPLSWSREQAMAEQIIANYGNFRVITRAAISKLSDTIIVQEWGGSTWVDRGSWNPISDPAAYTKARDNAKELQRGHLRRQGD